MSFSDNTQVFEVRSEHGSYPYPVGMLMETGQVLLFTACYTFSSCLYIMLNFPWKSAMISCVLCNRWLTTADPGIYLQNSTCS